MVAIKRSTRPAPVMPWLYATEEAPPAVAAFNAMPPAPTRGNRIQYQFHHGIGDTSNHVHALKCWLSRGWEVEVSCPAEREFLFQAAGAKTQCKTSTTHTWNHALPVAVSDPLMPWAGNKTAHSFLDGPMPRLGVQMHTLWQETLSSQIDLDPFVDAETRAKVKSFVDELPRPLICLHSKGNTSSAAKSFSNELEADTINELLNWTDGTIVILDWDNRCQAVASQRVRHMLRDWDRLDLKALYCLLQEADLLIGVDSGVGHFARFTHIPQLQVWFNHHPCSFALPRRETVHLVPSGTDPKLTWAQRFNYQIVNEPSYSGAVIAEHALRLLDEPEYLDDVPADMVLRALVQKTDQVKGALSHRVDRHKSFDKLLRVLKYKHKPCVVETGCIRAQDDWHAGSSSLILSHFLRWHGGTLTSIDNDAGHVSFARKILHQFAGTTSVVQADSVSWLQGFKGQIDGLYLDSMDTHAPGFADHCLAEVQAALPRLSEGDGTPILIDDTVYAERRWKGKGEKAVPWLLEQGWRILYSGYQTLLLRPTA